MRPDYGEGRKRRQYNLIMEELEIEGSDNRFMEEEV